MTKNTTAVAQGTVDFHGQQLTVITGPSGEHLVAMRPICEAIGLAWNGQFERIKRDEVLSTCIRVIRTQAEGDDQARNVVFLPVDYLNGWLFGIDVARCREEIRPALIQYKRECYAALAAYWQQGEAVNPRKGRKPKALPNGLTADQQDSIKALVKARVEALPKDKQAKAAITCWSALKSKFGCSYKEIAPEQFTEAVSLVARLPLEGEWLGKASSTKAGTFADILGRPMTSTERWLVYADSNGNEHLKSVPDDACVLSHRDLIRGMLGCDIPVHPDEMFEFALAAIANIKIRYDNQYSRIRAAREAGLKI